MKFWQQYFFWLTASGIVLAIWTVVLAAIFYRGFLFGKIYRYETNESGVWTRTPDWVFEPEGAWTVQYVGDTLEVLWIVWLLIVVVTVQAMILLRVQRWVTRRFSQSAE